MPRNLLIAAVLLAIASVAVAGYWVSRPQAPAWTTDSPQALAEFERGFVEMSKFYWAEAEEHFRSALELDPDFAMAKVHLAEFEAPDRREELWAELETVDREKLNPDERFLLEYRLARRAESGGEEAAQALLDRFLAQHPKSFFGLRARCDLDWQRENFDQAIACYNRLLELHPNWVQGHNRLGYVAMAQGRFTEAEEHFLTYRYIAPDQSNPYDSMAELLILLGRYREAEDALATALKLKPDFCHAYMLRARLGLYSGRLEMIEESLGDLAAIPVCVAREPEGFACSSRVAVLYMQGDAEGAWQYQEENCPEETVDLFAYRAALQTGRHEACDSMEKVLQGRLAKADEAERPVAARFLRALLAHLEGLRALAAGDPSSAVERLTAADELAGYWGYDERSSFKMLNRVDLLTALDAAGETARSDALRRKIEAVNPRILKELRLPELGSRAAG